MNYRTFLLNKRKWCIGFVGLTLLFFAGCKSEDVNISSPKNSSSIATPSLDMSAPDSITGGKSSSSSSVAGMNFAAAASNSKLSCKFYGSRGNDPFENGYSMTKFLIGISSEWTCFTEFLMTNVMAMGFPIDGTYFAISPDGYGGPTGISVKQDSSTQNTIRIYYKGDTTTPGMFISWNTVGTTTQGRLVLAASMMGDSTGDEPDNLRLDFNYTSSQQIGDLFASFPVGNSDVQGFRAEVTKTMSDGSFIAKGRMDMKGFWGNDATMDSWTNKPSLLMYTIADSTGKGAASAHMTDVGFPLVDLGYYQFTMVDKYFFTAAGASEFISKSIPSAVYKGGRTIIDASADTKYYTSLASFGLSSSYFSATCTGTVGSVCTGLVNGVFSDPIFGREQNSGSDPGDSRSSVINALTTSDYLSSVYPTGSTSWTGVFDMSFTPTN